MEYLDEQIVKLRHQSKLEGQDIYGTGLSIKGEPVRFRETELFQGKMTIWLPDTFVDMPSRIARLKYPSEQRPQVIKTDLLGSTNFAFNLFDKIIRPDQMQSAAEGMKSIIKKVNPANIFYSGETEPIGDTQISWFEFKGHGIDTQIYYIVFLTSIGGKLLHGIFNCAIADMEEWKNPVLQVIHSIQDNAKEV